jgi:hypothetical protein
MAKPKTLKEALENGYVIKSIYARGSKKCRVDVKPRFYKSGMKAVISYWLTSDYVKRTYPRAYDSL